MDNNMMAIVKRQIEMSKIIAKNAYELKMDNRHDFLNSLLTFYKTYKEVKNNAI